MSEHSFVTDDRVRIVYADLGPMEGTPIVLCHGLAAAGEQFAADAEYFAALGYRVLVPNLRGHGVSGRPDGYAASDYAIARMAADLTQMLDVAGVQRVHWVGNSLGGIVALDMLARCPERFLTLATFGTSYALRLPRFGAGLIPLAYRVLGARLTAALTAFGTTRNPAARRLTARVLRKFDPRVGHAVAANLVRYDLIANAVKASGVPILMLRGSLDGE